MHSHTLCNSCIRVLRYAPDLLAIHSPLSYRFRRRGCIALIGPLAIYTFSKMSNFVISARWDASEDTVVQFTCGLRPGATLRVLHDSKFTIWTPRGELLTGHQIVNHF